MLCSNMALRPDSPTGVSTWFNALPEAVFAFDLIFR